MFETIAITVVASAAVFLPLGAIFGHSIAAHVSAEARAVRAHVSQEFHEVDTAVDQGVHEAEEKL